MTQPPDRGRSNRLSAKAQWLVGIGLLAGLIAVFVTLGPKIMQTVESPEALAAAIRDAGAPGLVFMVGLQTFQVVLAPIPGQVTNFAAGYIYGFPLGTALSWIGTTLGAGLAMVLGRFLGRPVVERLVSPSFLARADRLLIDKGLQFFFLLFLLPGLPDDAICLIAGLTPLPLSLLLLAAAVGRLPALAVSAWVGAHAGAMSPSLLLAGAVLSVILLVIAWRYGERIEAAVLDFVGRIKEV